MALGDSLTAGWMEPKGYVDILEELLKAKYPRAKIKIINCGIPGDTASGGLHRFNSQVLPHSPDLLIIQFGLNDAYMGFSPTEFADKINRIIAESQQHTQTEIIVISSTHMTPEFDPDQLMEKFYNTLKTSAQQYGCTFVPLHKQWKDTIANGTNPFELVQPDGVHPTMKGYHLMAETIFDFF